MTGDSFEYEGDLTLGEQEGGFAAPSVEVRGYGWFTRGKVRELTHPGSLDRILERMGITEWGPFVRVRLSIEVTDGSAAEAAIAEHEAKVERYRLSRGIGVPDK